MGKWEDRGWMRVDGWTGGLEVGGWMKGEQSKWGLDGKVGGREAGRLDGWARENGRWREG